MGVNKLLNISSRSLQVYQNALTVTSHNIANVNNDKYSRQRVLFNTENADKLQNYTIGSGIKLDQINRVKNNLLDLQIMAYNKQKSYTEQRSETLTSIESLYSEPGPLGMSSLINGFFDSWDKLAVDPTSIPLRQEVVNSANKFTTKLESVYDGYNRIKSDISTDLNETTSSLNNYLEQIFNLNQQVYNETAVGRQPNDLLDERDYLVGELSKLVNININYDEYNVANISIGNSFAVDRKYFNSYQIVEKDNKLILQTKDGIVDVPLYGGKMKALQDMYNTVIPDHQSQLDEIANSLMTEVNAQHSAGYTLHSTPLTNINFFSSYGNGVLRINENILNDPKYVAAASDSTPGNNQIAINISKIKGNKLIDGLTLSDGYSKLVSDIANDKLLNDQKTDSYQMVVDQMNIQKSEYSGVSVDEEMINILKFQRSFDASAKLIQVADELLQTIIGLV